MVSDLTFTKEEAILTMLNYSLTTVLMAVLTGNFIIVLTALCFRHKNILLSVGYRLFIAFLFLTVARFLFPFELPVARFIYLPNILSVLLTYFDSPFTRLFGISVSLWVIFQCVWLMGIIYRLFYYVREQLRISSQLTKYSTDVTKQEPYAALLAQICGGRRNPFQVLKVYGISTPSIYGIIKPRILIPSEMELSGTDLYYSLNHEASHYYHRDLWIQCGVSILCIIYWWNPACGLLKKQMGMLLEMRVDDSLVKKDPATTVAYLNTLVHIAEESIRLQTIPDSALPESLLLSFTKERDGTLIQRCEMMCNTQKHSAHVPMAVILFALIAAFYMCSFFVTFKSNVYFSKSTAFNSSFISSTLNHSELFPEL